MLLGMISAMLPGTYISNINKIVKILNQRYVAKSSPQSTQLDNLNKAYNSRKLVLVLGAGVSIGCGLPDWNTLLKKLRKNIHFNNSDRERSLVIEKIFLKLFNRTDLILARNIHQCFGFEPEINDSIIFENSSDAPCTMELN